jgi:beta-lactamase regulating signal transducer with metallopeptidase domain
MPHRKPKFERGRTHRAGILDQSQKKIGEEIIPILKGNDMTSFIETLNHWGDHFLNFAWPMLWQSSLLIAIIFVLDFALRRKIRAAIRYAFWLMVLVKLLLPPSLALPTSFAWWLLPSPQSPAKPQTTAYVVTYGDQLAPTFPLQPRPAPAPIQPKISFAAWTLAASGAVSAGLLAWLMIRWLQINQKVRRAKPSEKLIPILDEARRSTRLRPGIRLKLTEDSMSPAVCGLFRPVILLPQSLVEKLSAGQLRAVLLHEAIHLRRGDVWANCAQALLQIFYWWHPLLWLANARIRRVREEAVDDAVMLALRDDAEIYAPTLLEVAKLAFNRPLASLGLVGILESRSALRQRIERLVDFRAPRKAGLTFASLCGIFVFSAVALPMGEASAPAEKLASNDAAAVEQSSLMLKVNPEIFIRNIKAQATKSMLVPTNDYTAILLDVLRAEGVDCVPPNGIAFNTGTGEITTQNTPDKLEIFRQVIGQLNRADGKCELPLRNNFHRKSVVIEARIYQMPDADFDKFTSGLGYQAGQDGDPWWSASQEKFKQLVGKLESSGLPLIQRPRIQTGSGMPAEFFVGNDTNSVEFECKPFAADGFIELMLQGTVVSGAPASAFTNYFSAKASAEDHGGIVVRVKNYGGDAESNLVAVIGVQIVTNAPAHFQQRLQAIIKRNDGTNFVVGGSSGGTGSSSEKDQQQLFIRTFKVDTRTFVSNLKQFGSDVDKNADSAAILAAVRKFIAGLGVNLESPTGKTVFFNKENGILLVKATQSDLDTIERVVQALNYTEPQIHIKARFIEVPKKGFVIPQLFTNAVAGPMTGILSDLDFRTVLGTLEHQKGVETLAEPEAVLNSGYQVQMRATTIQEIITNFALQEIPNEPTSITAQTGKIETGPKADIVPYVLSDGYTINLTAKSSVLEFLGYEDAPHATYATNSTGKRFRLSAARPGVRIQRGQATVNLWDNQTLVLGNLKSDFIGADGQIQNESKFFQAVEKKKGTADKELLVFITATIVDPAGRRVHSDNELPFNPSTIPPQPKIPIPSP